MKSYLAALLFILPTVASAQNIKYTNVPICIRPYNPPVDAMRFYCGSAFWEERPFFWPQGGLRYGKWMGCDENAPLTIAPVVKGVEGQHGGLMVPTKPPKGTGNCWDDYTVPGTPLTLKQLPGPSDWLANLAADCLKDPACSQLVMDTCMKDTNCAALISSKVTTVDYDQNGVPGSPGDAYWLDLAIRGIIH